MLGRLISIFTLLLSVQLQVFAQLVSYSKDNGLTSSQITSYLVDSKGLVWIGTENGLNAFSEDKWFTIKSILNNQTDKNDDLGRIVKIFEDSKRNIWVSSSNGIFLYNGKFWVHYLHEKEEKLIAKDIFEDRQGRIWFGLENIKEFKEVTNLPIIMVSGIVYMFNQELWYRFDQMSGSVALMNNVPPKFFTTFLQDKSGNIWISSLEGIFQFYEDKIIEIQNDELRLIKVFALTQSNNGDIWVASEKGVFRFHEDKWMKYVKKDGLSGDFFINIMEDPLGRIWAFSTSDMKFTGFSMFDGSSWQQFDNNSIHLKSTVEKLVWSENEVLAYATDGIARFDSSGWHRFERKDGLSEKSYSMMIRDKYKNIWLAGEKGFFQYVNKKWINLFEPHIKWSVNQIIPDKKGHVWIATTNAGVFQYANKEWKQYTVANGLPDNNVSDVFEDRKGDIWFITKKGISKTNEQVK
jgi:ligand-binding sensor domain-containing protein